MSRKSRESRQAEGDAYRFMAPAMFWFLGYGYYQMMNLLGGIRPEMRVVGLVGGVALAIVGLGFVPRSIRLARDLVDGTD
jgi:hypothetical protein